jgi:rubrerythrin
MSSNIVGASIWEQQLYDHIAGHVAAEAEVLESYARLADDETISPAFRYLARLILDDERRHHDTFRELAETIRHTSQLDVEGAPIPPIAGLRADRDRVVAITNRLIEIEEHDARTLKDLAKELKDVRDTTMWALVVDLMRDDTEKHLKILRFVRDRATASPV